jgi:hypothetical protein
MSDSLLNFQRNLDLGLSYSKSHSTGTTVEGLLRELNTAGQAGFGGMCWLCGREEE